MASYPAAAGRCHVCHKPANYFIYMTALDLLCPSCAGLWAGDGPTNEPEQNEPSSAVDSKIWEWGDPLYFDVGSTFEYMGD